MGEARVGHPWEGGQDTVPPELQYVLLGKRYFHQNLGWGLKGQGRQPQSIPSRVSYRVPTARTARRGPKGEPSGHSAERRERGQFG